MEENNATTGQKRRRRKNKRGREAQRHTDSDELQPLVSYGSLAQTPLLAEEQSVGAVSLSAQTVAAPSPVVVPEFTEAAKSSPSSVQLLGGSTVALVDKTVESHFSLHGLPCASCASHIESHIGEMGGVAQVTVNFASSHAVVVHNPHVVGASRITEEMEAMGYTAVLISAHSDDAEQLDNLGVREFELLIGGMTCGSCVSRVQSALLEIDVVKSCTINFSTGTCKLTMTGGRDSLNCVQEEVKKLGYTATPLEERGSGNAVDVMKEALERTKEIQAHKRAFVLSTVLATPLAVFMILMTVTKYFEDITTMVIVNTIQLYLATPIVFYCGSGFFSRAWVNLKHRTFTMDTLVALGAGCSYLYSVAGLITMFLMKRHVTTYFDTAGMLVAFMLLGRYLEAYAKRHTNDALIKLMNLVPPTSLVVTPAGDVSMPSSTVKKGMRVRVLAGDRVPVDGVVVEGNSDVDEQMVTGESVPKPVSAGGTVVGGTTNLTAMIVIEATKVGEEAVLSQILRVVREAQNSKPAIQRIADKVAARFVPAVIIFSLVVLAVWLLLGAFNLYPSEWRGNNESTTVFAFDFFIATIVAACPCALGLATPTAIMVGTGVGAKHGILVKCGMTLEAMRRTRCVVFDKTGTITNGTLCVVFQRRWGNGADAAVDAVGAVEQRSNHPISRAIAVCVASDPKSQVAAYEVVTSTVHSGLGVKATVQHKDSGHQLNVFIGNMDMMLSSGIDVSGEVAKVVRWQMGLGRTVTLAAVDGSVRFLAALADEPKAEAAGVIRFLKRQNIRVFMVTGDNPGVAAAVAQAVGISQEDVYAGALPVTKAAVVKAFQEEYRDVVFVGDGINDGPALAQASVGVALGAGTEIAIEAADAVLVRNSLVDLLNLRALSITTVRHVYGNFMWAFGYNVLILPLASGMLYPFLHVRVPPVVAGVAMILSSLSVLMSSLSIRCFSPYKREQFIDII
ncbi:copper-transporting ATPase-like protein,putative [Trypanosoma brucei gambiense DAL972]|uniref:Copper-transporting ATPase-like protein,putative n=1 Tax=Trypanosoma brucei gambiense (strain MHOM/CI/86/DAL972) TaxID=679716 RepID=D0A5R6_TRYB9|nr:copper-transporting ATPase-like protein,putative [Trypanosoma brucei gambiense DAL972]CBH17017.1 copper-transporting ATPase-like protein,putative [Trypanosoma brucei gambiense DAL972]|eukprot:XP_011779281.1 copper-transporting ATPase-like protein,putative [Trypanosoma brucei gambiense DAL972]